jgi:hypothetical protein
LTSAQTETKLELCLCWRSSGAEQLPCKQWVGGSNPPASASFRGRFFAREVSHRHTGGSGRYPSGQRGQTVNLLAYAFGGSNPPLPTTVAGAVCTGWVAAGLIEVRVAPIRTTPVRMAMDEVRGNSSAVERQPSKLGVAGSNPVSRSRDSGEGIRRAHVAQLAERVLGKDEVSGSNPDMGSSLRAALITPVDGR